MRRRILLGLLAAFALVALVPFAFGAVLRARESNPVLRGRRVAMRAGCFSCHQPFGEEIPDPGSRWGTVPRLGGGNAVMYGVETRDQIEEYIRFGAKRASIDDPEVRARLERQPIRMPAFGERLSHGEIDDVVAWVAAMEGIDLPGDERAQAGRELARKQGCPSCHGVEGAGGTPNPRALGGIVPGFAGRNFADLVRNEREFREWVETGTLRRLAGNPVARFAWRRQTLKMPPYRGRLSAEEIDKLWSWVQALRGPGASSRRAGRPNDPPGPKSYSAG
jgi:mono/diheme cytochrome c family protein